jgi:hypothetical protein
MTSARRSSGVTNGPSAWRASARTANLGGLPPAWGLGGRSAGGGDSTPGRTDSSALDGKIMQLLVQAILGLGLPTLIGRHSIIDREVTRCAVQ